MHMCCVQASNRLDKDWHDPGNWGVSGCVPLYGLLDLLAASWQLDTWGLCQCHPQSSLRDDRCLSLHHGLMPIRATGPAQPVMQRLTRPWSHPSKMRTQVPLCIAGVFEAAPWPFEQQLVPYCQLIHVL